MILYLVGHLLVTIAANNGKLSYLILSLSVFLFLILSYFIFFYLILSMVSFFHNLTFQQYLYTNYKFSMSIINVNWQYWGSKNARNKSRFPVIL